MDKWVRDVLMKILLLGCVFGVAVSLALADPPASARAPGPMSTEQLPAYTSTKRVAEEWLGDRPRQVIILPSEAGTPDKLPSERSGGVVAKLPQEPHRLPEGYVVGARPAHIEQKGDWYLAHLVPQEEMPDTPPLRLLPNQYLAMIETVLAETDSAPEFLLTGRVTEFQGTNYLLIEHVAELLPPVDRPTDVAPIPAASEPSQIDSTESQAIEPTTTREPTAEEIIHQLMKSKPVRAMVLPQADTEKQPPAQVPTTEGDESADAQAKPLLSKEEKSVPWPEASLLIDRLGRILAKSDTWWSLAFEDRGRRVNQKPIRLLPNRLLETAIALSGGGRQGVVFSVSGEVTVYKGHNYLLLRKVLVQRNLGNLH